MFELINECFNKINDRQFEYLLGSLLNHCVKTPLEMAELNGFNAKLNTFRYLNHKDDTTGNTLFHELVIKRESESLSLILELIAKYSLTDLIGFNLRNFQNYTALDLAVQMKNFDAMYLLSHFQPDVSSMDVSLTIHKCSPRQLI